MFIFQIKIKNFKIKFKFKKNLLFLNENEKFFKKYKKVEFK